MERQTYYALETGKHRLAPYQYRAHKEGGKSSRFSLKAFSPTKLSCIVHDKCYWFGMYNITKARIVLKLQFIGGFNF